MSVTVRDLVSVATIIALLACWRVSHVKADLLGQLAASRQQELARAQLRESESAATVDRLTATVDQLTAKLDENENQHVLMRRLLLMPTKLLP